MSIESSNSTQNSGGSVEQVAGDQSPPVEEDGRPVETGAAEGAGGGGAGEIKNDQVEDEQPTAEDLDFVPQVLRQKTVGKVDELAERLAEIMRGTPGEVEAARSYAQDLGGRYAGWRLVVDVRVAVRRSPE